MGCLRLSILEQNYTPLKVVQDEVPKLRVSHRAESSKKEGCAGLEWFGFQGQEQDNEIKGSGNSLAFKYRVHDPRLGRFLSVDPLYAKYPYYSQYAFSGNRVIDAFEFEGLEPVVKNKRVVGYDVKDGQGPKAIADDINNPMTQKKFGYTLAHNIDWRDIVGENFGTFENNSVVSDYGDIDDLGYWDMNINPGDRLSICSECIRATNPSTVLFVDNQGSSVAQFITDDVASETYVLFKAFNPDLIESFEAELQSAIESNEAGYSSFIIGLSENYAYPISEYDKQASKMSYPTTLGKMYDGYFKDGYFDGYNGKGNVFKDGARSLSGRDDSDVAVYYFKGQGIGRSDRIRGEMNMFDPKIKNDTAKYIIKSLSNECCK